MATGMPRSAQLLDEVVIGAGLRRGHDQAVDGRVLHDLVEDLDLARDVVDRGLGAQHDQVDAEGLGRDLGADIGRVEEAVAGGMGDDGEGELAVLGVEVLGARRFLGGVLEGVAADGLGQHAGALRHARRPPQQTKCPPPMRRGGVTSSSMFLPWNSFGCGSIGSSSFVDRACNRFTRWTLDES